MSTKTDQEVEDCDGTTTNVRIRSLGDRMRQNIKTICTEKYCTDWKPIGDSTGSINIGGVKGSVPTLGRRRDVWY